MSAVRVVCRREIGILTQVDGDAPVARQRLDPSGTARTGPWITAPLAGVGAWQTSAAQTLDAKAAPIVAATEALAIDPAAVAPAGRTVRCARCKTTWFAGAPAAESKVDAFVDGVIADEHRQRRSAGDRQLVAHRRSFVSHLRRREFEAHARQRNVEFLGDEHRERGRDALTQLGIVHHHGRRSVAVHPEPGDRGEVLRRRGSGRSRAQLDPEREPGSGDGDDAQKRFAIQCERHATPAALLIACLMRG